MVDLINAIGDGPWIFLRDYSLRALLPLLVWGAVVLAARRREDIRHAAAVATVASLLVLPLLETALPVRWSLFEHRTTPMAEQTPFVRGVTVDDSAVDVPSMIATGSVAAVGDLIPERGARPISPEASTNDLPGMLAEATTARLDWRSMLVVTWFTVAILFCLRDVVAWRKCIGITRAGTPPSERLSFAVDRIARRMRANLRCVVSDAIAGPAVFGAFRPVILFPRGLEDRLDDRSLSAVLEHEVAHVVRNDPRICLAARLVRHLLWHVPPVWWLCRSVHVLAELLTDCHVLARIESRADYAEGLLRVLESRRTVGGFERVVLGIKGKESRFMKLRFDRILSAVRPGQQRIGLRTKFALAAVFLLAGVVSSMSGIEVERRPIDGESAAQEVRAIGIQITEAKPRKSSLEDPAVARDWPVERLSRAEKILVGDREIGLDEIAGILDQDATTPVALQLAVAGNRDFEIVDRVIDQALKARSPIVRVSLDKAGIACFSIEKDDVAPGAPTIHVVMLDGSRVELLASGGKYPSDDAGIAAAARRLLEADAGERGVVVHFEPRIACSEVVRIATALVSFGIPTLRWARLRPGGGIVSKGSRIEGAVAHSVGWLLAHQAPDGSWSNDQGKLTVGSTGLALLCLLGSGQAKSVESSAAVDRGLSYLVSMQGAEGHFGSTYNRQYNYEHALATLALSESNIVSGDGRHRTALDLAVKYCLASRNPYRGWRYGERPGDNDSAVTGWMLMALASAKSAGMEVPKNALYEGMELIEELTDETTGRTGYIKRGEPPVREEGKVERFPASESESLTAQTIFVRFLLGQNPDTNPVIGLGAKLMAGRLPTWDEARGSIDMYYWYFGTVANFQIGGQSWDHWHRALAAAALPNQITVGAEAGSWPPIDPWSETGGRVYATAMMTLSLEAILRYQRLVAPR